MTLLGLAAVVVWRTVAADSQEASPPPLPAAAPPSTPSAPGAALPPDPVVGPSELERTPERNEPEVVRTLAAADESPPQGLRGLLLDESQRALAGIDVYLLERAADEPLLLPLLLAPGAALSPVASTRSTGSGGFALGLPIVEERSYDLLVVSPAHAPTRLTGLTLLPGVWHDLGVVRLSAGAVVRGTVSVAGRSDIPVPQATVALTTGGGFADAELRALPAQASTWTATTDAAGHFELRRAPPRGTAMLLVSAPGFARVQHGPFELQTSAPVEVAVQLPPGQSLRGRVVADDGEPVADARLLIWAERPETPPWTARSDAQGRFEVTGLAAERLRVNVNAPGCEPALVDDLHPGDDQVLTVTRRASALVKVIDPRGGVVRRYRLALRRFFPTDRDADPAALRAVDGRIGATTDVQELRVKLSVDEEWAEFTGVPGGTFVWEVAADGYAVARSTPFQQRPGRTDAGRRFEVRVDAGSELQVQIQDDRGRPLTGATVTTQPDGMLTDNALARALLPAQGQQVTPAVATTGPDGIARLANLTHGNYQLQIDHPDACRRVVRGLRCHASGLQTLAPVMLARGAEVRGVATVDGRVAGQLEVVLATPAATPPEAAVRLVAITDDLGRYRMPRRVPPGDYELRAAAVGNDAAGSPVFDRLLQLQRSATPLTIAPDRDPVVCDLDIPTSR